MLCGFKNCITEDAEVLKPRAIDAPCLHFEYWSDTTSFAGFFSTPLEAVEHFYCLSGEQRSASIGLSRVTWSTSQQWQMWEYEIMQKWCWQEPFAHWRVKYYHKCLLVNACWGTNSRLHTYLHDWCACECWFLYVPFLQSLMLFIMMYKYV